MTAKTRRLHYWTANLAILFAAASLRATCLEIAETAVPPGERGEYECPGCRQTFQLPVPEDGTTPNCPVCGPRERLTLLGRPAD